MSSFQKSSLFKVLVTSLLQSCFLPCGQVLVFPGKKYLKLKVVLCYPLWNNFFSFSRFSILLLFLSHTLHTGTVSSTKIARPPLGKEKVDPFSCTLLEMVFLPSIVSHLLWNMTPYLNVNMGSTGATSIFLKWLYSELLPYYHQVTKRPRLQSLD